MVVPLYEALARHLTGNLHHFFGAGILKNNYHRDRDREFDQTGLPKAVVIADFKAALQVARLQEARLAQRCQEQVDGVALPPALRNFARYLYCFLQRHRPPSPACL
jgi:hypothetical protein